jgi:hypothetical protein
MTDFEQQMSREKEVSTDMNMVANILLSRGWSDKEQADELSSALVGYEAKYGRNLLRDLEDAINEAIYQACERVLEGEKA